MSSDSRAIMTARLRMERDFWRDLVRRPDDVADYYPSAAELNGAFDSARRELDKTFKQLMIDVTGANGHHAALDGQVASVFTESIENSSSDPRKRLAACLRWIDKLPEPGVGSMGSEPEAATLCREIVAARRRRLLRYVVGAVLEKLRKSGGKPLRPGLIRELGLDDAWHGISPRHVAAEEFRDLFQVYVWRYEELQVVFRSGQGEIVEALDHELDRIVYIKRPHDGATAKDHLRLIREAEITAHLAHPGIPSVHGWSRDGTRPYFVMEKIPGEDLLALIERFHARQPRRIDRNDAEFAALVRHLIDVCHTAAFAHEQVPPVIHRDLKPKNVLVGQFRETYVIDWGTAKVGTETEDETGARPSTVNDGLTQTAETLGTPDYMPPEQARPDEGEVTPRSDVYSLGSMLYHMICGRYPLAAMTRKSVLAKLEELRDWGRLRTEGLKIDRELADGVRHQKCNRSSGDVLLARLELVGRVMWPPPIPPKRSFWQWSRPAVDSELQAICLKAMRSDPKQRYPSSRAFAERLENWLSDTADDNDGVPWLTQVRNFLRRHVIFRVMAWIVLSAILAYTAHYFGH